MANIIWSFGIALTAKDEASEPVNNVIQSINAMDRSLAELNERQISNIETVRSLTQEYETLTSSMTSGDAARGLNASADAASGLSSSLETVALTAELAAGSATGGIGLIVGKVVEEVTVGIYHVVSGLFSAIEFVVGTVVPTILKVGFEATKAITSVVSGILSTTWSIASGIVSKIPDLLGFPINAVRGLLHAIVDIPTALASWVFNRYIDPVVALFDKVSMGVSKFVHLADEFYPMQHQLNVLAVQMGLNADAAKMLERQVQGLTFSTGLSMQQNIELAESLAHVGIMMDKTGKYPGLGDDSIKSVALLANRFGLGADEAARFSRSTQLLGIDFKGLLDSTAEFQTKFRIPGLMQILPELTDMARNSIARFGKAVVGDQEKVVTQTLKTSAVFSKAFGKDIRESANMARETFEAFSGAISQDQDVFLGLGDSFSGLSDALMESGVDFQQLPMLLKQGQDEPVKFAESIRNMTDGLRALDPSGLMAERALRRITRTLPQSMQELIRNDKVFDEARKAFDAANEISASKGAGAFMEMSKSINDSMQGALQVFDNLKQGIKSIFGSIFSDTVKPFVTEFDTWLSGAGSTILTFFKDIDNNPHIATIKKLFNSLALTLFDVGENSDSLQIRFKKLLNSFNLSYALNAPLKAIEYTLEVISDAVSSIKEKGLFEYITETVGDTIKTVKNFAFSLTRDLMNIFMAPIPTSKKFQDVLQSVFYRVGDLFNNLLGGIPNKLIKEFFPKFEGTFATKLGAFGSWLGEKMTSIISSVGESIRSSLSSWADYVDSNWTSIQRTIATKSEAIGSTLGDFAVKIGAFVKDLFAGKGLDEAWTSFTKDFSTKIEGDESIWGSLLRIGGKVTSGAKLALKSFMDGFLKPFGTDFEEVFTRIQIGLNRFIFAAREEFQYFEEIFYDIKDVAIPVFKFLGTTIIDVTNWAVLPLVSLFSDIYGYVERIIYGAKAAYKLAKGDFKGAQAAADEAIGAESRAATRSEKIGGLSNTLSDVSTRLGNISGDTTEERKRLLERKIALAKEENAYSKGPEKDFEATVAKKEAGRAVGVAAPTALTTKEEDKSSLEKLATAIQQATKAASEAESKYMIRLGSGKNDNIATTLAGDAMRSRSQAAILGALSDDIKADLAKKQAQEQQTPKPLPTAAVGSEAPKPASASLPADISKTTSLTPVERGTPEGVLATQEALAVAISKLHAMLAKGIPIQIAVDNAFADMGLSAKQAYTTLKGQ